MKLYTEEQVTEAMKLARHTYDNRDEIFKRLTPIELPSDEEIRFKSHDFIAHFRKETFFDGAKWMKEQMLKQNK